jgi:predicted hotdog family 3-hydroxylacyl-ACP dehydratase
MCLLDEVVSWDTARILCRTASHRAADNPLLAHGRLGIACGIEYAAQAMAVHGVLASGVLEVDVSVSTAPAAGFLASVRAVKFFVSRLDDVAGDLLCDAVRVVGDAGTALYEFELRSADARLLCGRATVVLDTQEQLKS